MTEHLPQASKAILAKGDDSLTTATVIAVETHPPHLAVAQAGVLSTVGGVGALAILAVGAGIAWVILRPSFLVPRTNEAYVVRGAKGTHVLLDGGRLLVGTRRTTRVILNEVEVRVEKLKDDSVRTMDSLKANIIVVFHVGVKKDAESVKLAASRLAKDEQVSSKEIKEAVNARADDCIRGAAKNLTLDDIDMKKKEFEKAVLDAISQDLAKNGLEVLSVSVSEITEADNYNPADFLDAQGLEKRTAATETAKQQTFTLQQATLIKQKETELASNRRRLELEKADADAQANHDEQVNRRRAQVKANVEAEQSTQMAIAAEAKSQSDARIAAAERVSLQAQKAVLLEQESNKTVQLTKQAEREKSLAELKAAEQAAVRTAGLVAEAEARAKADLAVAQASVKVAEAE
ncbi:MAG TPA: SPFH domain-containing protein, partial [Candidatus Caenarcaniphilales bacterium]